MSDRKKAPPDGTDPARPRPEDGSQAHVPAEPGEASGRIRQGREPETKPRPDGGGQARNATRKPGGGPQRKADGPAKGGKRGAGKGPRRPVILPVVEVVPEPPRRRIETGQWVGLITFVVLVILPGVLAAAYLWTRAADQYASHVGFTVRQDAGVSAGDVLGGRIGPIGGRGPRSDTDILNEYLRSPALVAALDERLDLRAHYSAPHDRDPLFSLRPDASLSDLMGYWWRILYLRYDDNAGLIDLRVQAFDPDMATTIAGEILAEATRVINKLADQARRDAVRFAEEDVERAQDRLRQAREAVVAFQSRSQILDPESDVAGRLEIIAGLQADLAETLVVLDDLSETTRANDPRLAAAQNRIDVLRARIGIERETMATGGVESSYPALLAEYDLLAAERRHAAEALARAFVALDAARGVAARQGRYVIAYVAPTRAASAAYPKRLWWLAASIGAGFLVWFAVNVGYVSIRDRR